MSFRPVRFAVPAGIGHPQGDLKMPTLSKTAGAMAALPKGDCPPGLMAQPAQTGAVKRFSKAQGKLWAADVMA